MPNSDPHQAKGAWRHLGVRLGVFFLPIVLAWAALEWWASGVPNLYSAKYDRFQPLTNEVDTLIIGSSSAFFDTKPNLLSGSAFNLAYPGETFYETDQLMTKILPTLPKLKRVIVQVHYGSFFLYRPENWETWRQYCYQQAWGIPPMRLKDYLDCRMWSRLALRTPRYYLDLLAGASWDWMRNGRFNIDPPDIDQIDNRGWAPLVHLTPPPSDLLGAAAAKHVKFTQSQMKAKHEPEILASVDHVVSMLRQRGIEVDFVTMPVWRTFVEVQSQDCWNETQRAVAQRVNNSGIYYYNFLSAPQFEAGDFWDVDHLNATAAPKFTQLLNSALNSETNSNAWGEVKSQMIGR